MKSMTGFGTATRSTPSGKVTASLQSVNNRRGLDIHLQTPSVLGVDESSLRKQISDSVTRGRLHVNIEWEPKELGQKNWQDVDTKAYKHYADQLRKINPKAQVRTDTILRLPGVLVPRQDAEAPPLEEEIQQVVAQALTQFEKARAREGKALHKDILSRLQEIRDSLNGVRSRTPLVVEEYRKKLISRISELGVPGDLHNDERLMKEIALFADRCDISEEVIRLTAHSTEAKRLCQSGDSVGRNLEFLTQEMGREINTIGSKANDLEIANAVLAMKASLEKIREQVQNVE